MKHLILFGLFFSLNVTAACLDFNFQEFLNDVETDCREIVTISLENNGCSKDEVKKILSRISPLRSTQIDSGSATFCKYDIDQGIIQVMTDDMDPNPRAAIFFSKWD